MLFLLHDLYHLKSDGIMAIVLPHGVLFRGGEGDGTIDNPGDQSEGTIRRQLIENNQIDTIIGLPEDIFFGTGIPTIVMVLRKDRQENNVLIIDASKGYIKEGKKNKLRESDIKRIVETYKSRCDIPKFSRVVSKKEIRENGYNLNIPRYVNSSEDPENWDIYATMFGGIPKSELRTLSDYFNAFNGLQGELLEQTDTPCMNLKVDNLQECISQYPSVKSFVQQCHTALSNVNNYLCEHLMEKNKMMTIRMVQEEEYITKLLFNSLSNIPLVDCFNAYQLFADKWAVISQDLEMIQTEGFEATRVVDSNMVIKKKDDKEFEEQVGWQGRILPFELVQTTFLHNEWQALRDIEEKVENNASTIDEIYNELDVDIRDKVSKNYKLHEADVEPTLKKLLENVETEEITTLTDYLKLKKKNEKIAYISANAEINWQVIATSKDGTPSATAVKARIEKIRNNYPFPEDSMEKKFIKFNSLILENKQRNKDIKVAALALHEHTKEVIECNLSDEQVLHLLKTKWIDTLYEHLLQLPQMIVDSFVEKLLALKKKYSVTMIDVEHDIRQTSQSLLSMIDELTGSDTDMEALAEFKKILLL